MEKMIKLSERLQIPSKFLDIREMQDGVDVALKVPKDASDNDRAWCKFSLPFSRFLLSLTCYYLDELTLAASNGRQCLSECDDFLFGGWRSNFVTPEEKVDAGYWKHSFNWIQVFEVAFLWGSVLGEWEFLKKVGTFPEPNSFSGSYKDQERDFYVALGAFLREAPKDDLGALLGKASAGSKKSCKLLAQVISACVDQDAPTLQKALVDFLKYYKKSEFPKDNMTKKISIEGTFFVHWAEKEKIPLTVPPEFDDHIVRLR